MSNYDGLPVEERAVTQRDAEKDHSLRSQSRNLPRQGIESWTTVVQDLNQLDFCIARRQQMCLNDGLGSRNTVNRVGKPLSLIFKILDLDRLENSFSAAC